MAHKTTHNIKIEPLEATPLEEIPKISATLRSTFRSQKTKDVQYRLVQLRKLYWGLVDLTDKFKESLKQDLNKSSHDAHLSEIDFSIADLIYSIKNVEKWAKDDKDLDIPLVFAAVRPRLKKEPLGPVLIIGTYNFPLNLNVCPLIGAIAAGCPAVVKPSEHAPATAVVLKELVDNYLDPSAYQVVQGAIPETNALLDEKWEKIFYTGGANVAKIISKKAAETLTPVVLELGGKNPAFISRYADLALAAKRLMWGKTINAGQVCVSHNYVLIDRTVVDDFVKYLNLVNKEFFPNGAQASPDFARIINQNHFDRMKKMLDTTKGKIVLGGETDRDDLFIAPTAVLVDSPQDSMVQEESFGPIWAILPYDNVDDAINIVNEIDSSPLSLMTFGKKAENKKILDTLNSGGATMNDSFMHGSIARMPFGGVGQSGQGAYRGKASFDTFTHLRSVAETPTWMDGLLRGRYMPYRVSDLKQMQMMSGLKPDFDRNGKKLVGPGYWLWVIFGLGSPSAKGALLRWLLVLATSYVAVNRFNLNTNWLGSKAQI
ncbi:aldehyde dehydrogenase [Xylariales sp. PMI_506]|nr:aldehyde dehydrogenase [Xylariales sp. PMI_506]